MWPRPRLVAMFFFALAPAMHGQATPAPDLLPVPLYLDGRFAGEVDLEITGDEIRLYPDALLALIDDRLAPRVPLDAERLFLSDRPVAPEAFDALGLEVRFDWDELALRATIPPILRRAEIVPLSGARAVPEGRRVEPARFSLITNLDLFTRYTWEERRFELAATPELAINAAGVVLELEAAIRTGTAPFDLTTGRLTWDLPSLGYRVEAGDLTWQAMELVNVGALTGLSISREPALAEPRERRGPDLPALFLPRPSDVSIYLNEARLQRRRLDAGSYELVGLRLGDGINTVVVEWEGEEGMQSVELVLPSDGELLPARELDAGVAMAVAERDIARPVVASYQRYGFGPRVTVGLRQAVEALEFQLDLGGEALVATRAGTFALEPTVGIGPAERLLVDVPLRWYYVDSSPSSAVNVGASVGYRQLDQGAADRSLELSLAGYVNLAFADGFSFTPRALAARNLGDASTRFELRASLRRSIRGGSALSANIGYTWDGEPAFLASVTYSASFPERQQNLFVQQDLPTQELSAYWSRYAGEEARDIDFAVAARVPIDTSEVINLDGRVGYVHPLLRGTFGHGVSGVVDESDFRNATFLSVQSGAVVADGVFAMTLPVADSFALVVPGAELAETGVLVGRDGAGARTVAGDGVAVVPNLGSYAPFVVDVEPAAFVPGLDEDELRFVVVPRFRSGTVVRATPPATRYAGGILLDPDGEPIPFLLGRWSGPDRSLGEFFTDDEGYFELYNLAPGSYRLSFTRRPDLTFEIIVPADASGFVDLGELAPGELP